MEWFKNALSQKGLIWYAWKVALGGLTVGWVSLLYFPASALTEGRGYDLTTSLDLAIPFIPWTWWIYFPGYLAGVLFAILAMRDDRVFYRITVAIMLCQLLNTIIYLIVPSTFPRPWDWKGTGLTAEAIYWFWGFDPPNNTFPSSHVALAVLCAIAMWRERNPLRIIPTLTAIGIIITVHTTKQHYWIDAIAGSLVAYLSYRIIFALWPLREGAEDQVVLAVSPLRTTSTDP